MRAWLLASLVFGPVTGPLAVGAVWCARRGRWLSASACVAGIVAFWTLAPLLLGAEVALLRGRIA